MIRSTRPCRRPPWIALVFISALTLSVARAQSVDQASAGQQAEAYGRALEAVTRRWNSLCSDGKYSAYFHKTGCDAVRDITPAQMTDQATVTEAEKSALSGIMALSSSVSGDVVAAHRQYGGEHGVAVARLREQVATKSAANMQSLYDGQITWGDYNRARKNMYEEFSAAQAAVWGLDGAHAMRDQGDYAAAVSQYRSLADEGGAAAQVSLGNMYFYGRGVAADDDEAARWYRKAAEQGDAQGQAALGYLYKRGKGVQQDYAEAAQWLRKAAEQGYAYAEGLLGSLYADGRGVAHDDVAAIAWFRKAAEQGDTYAESWLGNMYRKGRGVARDDVAAAAWFRRAGEKGDAYSQTELGYLYRDSRVFTHDEVAAVAWFRRAADQGNAEGEATLGYMYEMGRGVAKSYGQAVEWYRKAAQKGLPRGQVNLGSMFRHGRGVAKDEPEAVAWYRKAAEQGDTRGAFLLAIMYRRGSGVARDYSQALAWNRKAAEQGDSSAQNNLGDMYEIGDGTPQDYTQALTWYRKSADQGNATGQLSLANLYEAGHGVAQDHAEALKWYQKAAEHGESRAQFQLGRMSESGSGLAKDDAQALRWYRKAAENGLPEAQARLGALYHEGRAFPSDLVDAVKWARQAANAPEVLATLENQAAESGIALDGGVASSAKSGKTAEGGGYETTDLALAVANLVKINEKALPVPIALDAKRAALAHELIDAMRTRDKLSRLDQDSDQPGNPMANLSPKLLEALRLTMAASFPPEVVVKQFERKLAETLDVTTLQAGLDWERSEVGRHINRLEAERIKQRDEYKEFARQSSRKGAAINDPRARACSQADILQNKTEAVLPLVEAVSAGVMMAALAQQGTPSTDMGVVEQTVVALRPILREASRQGALTQCLFELQDLSDAEFDQWLEFLRSDAGGRYARGASSALRDALLERAGVFTHVMLEVARQIRVRKDA
ncbi:MAG: tetratricopeptide repeat protein [Usitatibacter sp.]